MSIRREKITISIVDNLKAGEIVWDTEVANFAVRCQKRDKVYIFKKRIKGRLRQLSIGKHGNPWTPDTARGKAYKYHCAIAEGKDPAHLRDEDKARPTIEQMCERFMTDYAIPYKKASSVRTDRINLDNHVLPLLGKFYVADISISDIDKFMRDVKAGKTARAARVDARGGAAVKGGSGAANRAFAMLSKALSLSIQWGWRSDNPASHVSKFKERKIERFLSDREFAVVGDAMRDLEKEGMNIYALAAIRLLMFTGARRGEILTLEWSHVDFDRKILFLEDSKTGKKAIHLSAPALEVLSNIPKQKDNPYVICGAIEGAHLVNIRKPWGHVKDKASLKLKPDGSVVDVRLHDLRHTYASVAAMGGMSLPVIGKLLGHTQSSTTQRYAHLADDPLKEANEAIGKRLHSLMGSKTNNIVQIGGKK